MLKLESNGLFSLSSSGFGIGAWDMMLEVDGTVLRLAEAKFAVEDEAPLTVRYDFPEVGLSWRVVFVVEEGAVLVDTQIGNHSLRGIRLGKAHVLASDSVTYNAAGDNTVALPWTIWGKTGIHRLDDPALATQSKVLTQFFNHSSGIAMQAAFTAFRRCNVEVVMRYEDSALAGMGATCDFAGWELAPGTSTTTERFRLAVGTDPFGQLESWADMVQKHYAISIAEEAPLGYLGWSWTDCVNGSEDYETVTLQVLDAINEKLGGFNFKYLWTSMANFAGSLPGNWLKWNRRCLPSGREKFIGEVAKRGFFQGFWIAPFYICSSLPGVMEEFGDALLRDENGELLVVCPEWRHGDAGMLAKKDRPHLYALDPSHPKSIEFIREVFTTYHDWGVRYFMIDFLEAGAGNIHRFPYRNHHDSSLVAGPEAYTKFLAMIRESAGEDTYLLSATGPSIHNAGFVDGARTGNDFGEGRAISPEAFFFPASYVINNLDFWTGAKYALNNQGTNYFTHRKLYLNDSGNVLTVDKPLPLSHARIHATIHALSGGPSMLGDDVRHLTEDRLELIRKTLPRTREVARPLDMFDNPQPIGPSMFHRRIETGWGSYDVLALYNFASAQCLHDIPLEKLGLDPDKEYLVWDFWNEQYVGPVSGRLRHAVSPESVSILRLVENTGSPVILGTDMHVLMGEMEIGDFSWEEDSMTCAFSATRPLGLSGTVFIHAPNSVRIRNIDGLHIAKDGRDNTLVIAVPLTFDENESQRREIQFAGLNEILDMSKLDLA